MVLAKEAPEKGIWETRYESRLRPIDYVKEAVAIKEQAPQDVSTKTPLVVFALCALTFASSLALAPDALSIALVLVALGFCLATALGMRYPRWATALFLLTFSAAMLLQVDEFPAFVFLAPFFCGVIAFSGKRLLTTAVTLSAFVLGTLDPTVTSPRDYLESLAPSAVFAWLIFLLLGAGAGWLIGYLDRRNAFLNDSWEADLERTRQDLAETLHDSVAGPLTSVVMQAETMELQLDAEPDSHLDSETMRKNLNAIADNSREAMAQSRKLLDLLRSTEQELSHAKAPLSRPVAIGFHRAAQAPWLSGGLHPGLSGKRLVGSILRCHACQFHQPEPMCRTPPARNATVHAGTPTTDGGRDQHCEVRSSRQPRCGCCGKPYKSPFAVHLERGSKRRHSFLCATRRLILQPRPDQPAALGQANQEHGQDRTRNLRLAHFLAAKLKVSITMNNAPVTRILVVDDDARALTALRHYFSVAKDIEIVAEAENGAVALEQIERLGGDLDLVLADIHMPEVSGIELLRTLQSQDNPPVFVAMTSMDTDETMLEILTSGGAGYIIKSARPVQFIQAIRDAMNGGTAVSPRVPFTPRGLHPRTLCWWGSCAGGEVGVTK